MLGEEGAEGCAGLGWVGAQQWKEHPALLGDESMAGDPDPTG